MEQSPVISQRVGRTLLEFMQEAKGRPYHAPTVQVRGLKRGAYTDYEPANPLAEKFSRLIGRQTLSEGHLVLIEEMGMVVERRFL